MKEKLGKKLGENTFQKIRKTYKYPFLIHLISTWKPRCKKIGLNLKDLAVEAKVSPQHLTKIITKDCNNPKLDTIDAVEMTLLSAEKRAGLYAK